MLLADEGIGIRPSAEHLGVALTTVRNWRLRWLATKGARVAERLAGARAPALYSAEEACAIIAWPARTDPCESQLELADEAIKPGIVPAISQRSVERIPKRC